MKIEFTKMVASGNDFIVTEIKNLPPWRDSDRGGKKSKIKDLKDLSRQICHRKYGVGADGLLVIEPSKKANLKMRIFNPDGSEVEMCGNGARCLALWMGQREKRKGKMGKNLKIETKAGILEAEVKDLGPQTSHIGEVRIKMTEPYDLKLDLAIKVRGRKIRVNYINTGVPHTVIFVQGLDDMDVERIGQEIRFHREFRSRGTNVDFVEFMQDNNIKIRTYERGVEAETLACGTGAVASAIISNIKYQISKIKCRGNVETKSGEILKVYFSRDNGKINNVWLEGRVRIVYGGEAYV